MPLLVQCRSHAFRDHRRLLIRGESDHALKSLRASEQHTYVTTARIGGDPSFVRCCDALAASLRPSCAERTRVRATSIGTFYDEEVPPPFNLAPEWGEAVHDFAIRSSGLPERHSRDEITMVGILVHGDNHFIVRGPLPDRDVAIALVQHWSLIRIGATTPPPLDRWHIISRAFRENLEWAVVVPGSGKVSPAVTTLLEEMSARGITIHNSQNGLW